MDFFHNRRAQLVRAAKGADADAYLITHRPNVRYLSGLDVPDALLLTAKGTLLVCDDERVPPRKTLPPDVTPAPRTADAPFEQAAAEAIKAAGVKAVAVEADHLSVSALQRLTAAVGKTALRPVAGRVEELRATKDPSEVDAVRKAVQVATRALYMFRAVVREVDTELELCRQMDQLLLRAGATAPAFPSVVALGEHGGAADHRPTADQPIGEVGKVFVHWGAVVEYCGVLARTFRSPFGAPPLRKTKNERTAHSYDKVRVAVRQAMAAAVAAVRPDATAGQVAAAARGPLAAAGYDRFAPAEVGHGVGLEPREGPFLRPDDPTPLFPGMVLNVTPQVRIPEWGIVKYSTTVVVTRDGASELGGSPADDD